MGGNPSDIHKQRKPLFLKFMSLHNHHQHHSVERIRQSRLHSTLAAMEVEVEEVSRVTLHPAPSAIEIQRSSVHCPCRTDSDVSSSFDEQTIITPRSTQRQLPNDNHHHHQQSTPTHKKSVTFTNLEIREYEVVIGDHPCCTQGVPVTLGWQYRESERVQVDDYEFYRCPRRSRCELRLAEYARQELLLNSISSISDSDHSSSMSSSSTSTSSMSESSSIASSSSITSCCSSFDCEESNLYRNRLEEFRRAQRKLHRVRSCSAKLCERMNAHFFEGEEESGANGICSSNNNETPSSILASAVVVPSG